MEHRIARASAWIVALLCISTPSLPQNSASLAITHVNVVDVIGGRVDADRTITIRDGKIARVDGSAAPAGARIIDAKGKFLIPGLWDMHAHTGGPTPTPALEHFQAKWLELYVLNRVTGIRDMGSGLEVILKLRAATASGAILGPRIFTAGPILDDAPGDWPLRLRVMAAADGRAAVQMLKAKGVDLIKVHDHTPREAFFAIAGEARRQQLPLAGHRPLAVTPLAALQSATLAPARYLKMEQTLGSIAPGKRADLVLLDANPLEDISNTRRIRAVVLGGHFLDRSEVERRLSEVRDAAVATEKE